MRMNLQLGIIWRDGKIINHRSLLKVALNPILRVIGYEIATEAYQKGNAAPELGKSFIRKCPRRFELELHYDTTDCGREKSRRFI